MNADQEDKAKLPVLYIVIPCYNEEVVLPVTSKLFLQELESLRSDGKISIDSRVFFVDDGSQDDTWSIIKNLSKSNEVFQGMTLSKNRGHQNALLAGLMEVRTYCDIAISVDCDGQDDITTMNAMVDAYHDGCEIVYGVRSDRSSDTLFKKKSAQLYYRVLSHLGVDNIYNHADYRLMSSRALDALSQFNEVNIYLRGMVPLIGFKSTCIEYVRHERIAGKSHYPIKKMFALAFDGITSFSVKPIRFIAIFGLIVSLVSLLGIAWAIISSVFGHAVAGWASLLVIACFWGGAQLFCVGIIGEYIGKIYLETKKRPRFIVSERTTKD